MPPRRRFRISLPLNDTLILWSAGPRVNALRLAGVPILKGSRFGASVILYRFQHKLLPEIPETAKKPVFNIL